MYINSLAVLKLDFTKHLQCEHFQIDIPQILSLEAVWRLAETYFELTSINPAGSCNISNIYTYITLSNIQ